MGAEGNQAPEAGGEADAVTIMTVNSEPALQNAIGELREQFRLRKYIQVKVLSGKARSLDQNAIIHAWFEQVARELRDDDARGVKRFCKLHFGVPILRAENDEFREAYDGSILRTLTYEQKLVAMDMMPVTSIMKTLQISRFMDDMRAHYFKQGVHLEFPA